MSLLEASLVIVIGVIVAAILWPAIGEARRSRAQNSCKNNIKAISLALHHYHETHGVFPQAYMLGSDGKRWHSWRVTILPQLGHVDLHKQYRWDEPWDGPSNSKLIAVMPDVFRCPAGMVKIKGTTNYYAIVGPQTVWPNEFSAAHAMVTNGISGTIQIVESDNLNALWTEPRDLTFDEYRRGVNTDSSPSVSSRHQTGVNTGFADGVARFVSAEIDLKTWERLGEAAGGGPLPIPGVTVPIKFTNDYAPTVRQSSDMSQTTISATPHEPIQDDKNIVTCATMPLAWGELKSFLMQDHITLSPSVSLADRLNEHLFPRSALDDNAYLAMAGLISEGRLAKIRETHARKFPNATLPLPDPGADTELLVYSYLFKQLPQLSG